MLFIEFYTLAVPKQVLEFKYAGGIAEFQQHIPNHSYHEDEHLATARFVRIDELFHFINHCEEHGLHFDQDQNYSEDFAVYSFMGMLWEANWLQTNLFQLWMKGSN
ncbi:hypothetical protein [Desertivirga xinjiangensis]|uniref:hypothetical protein n=1 Tax=Desertivirga xinjiangensis TaxID=539206 RepID=UPI00210C05B4|nr:hypothetical protein [Pedobacter xinjiangensis]